MALVLSIITSGAFENSETVHVECGDVNGTTILLHRGTALIGSALLLAGACDIAVEPLAAGDVIQASVSERGNRCGLPTIVSPSAVRTTGWKTATELEVITADGSVLIMDAELFRQTYGYGPASIYDPNGVGALIPREYENTPTKDIAFDVMVTQTYGQTAIAVVNFQNVNGAPLVQFGSDAFGNATSKSFSAGGTVTINVKGDQDSTQASRDVPFTVLDDPASPAAQITGYVWRGGKTDDGVGYVKLEANSVVQLESRLVGFDSTWRDMVSYDPNWQESLWANVAHGPYNIQIRVKNDANPANWISYPINKTY